MNYFISENVFSFNSGTELSQAQRVRMFNTAGQDTQYVTKNYNRYLQRDSQEIGLSSNQVLGMYDYFQGTTEVPRMEQNLRLLPQFPLDEYKIEAHGPNYSTVDYEGRTVARVDVMPATVGLVDTVTYYDRFGNPTVRDNFDWRGFKSSVDYFHPGGELAVQKFLNLDGDVVLEIVHMNINNEVKPTMYKLLNYKGHDYRFNYEDQLFLFFLNELTASQPGALVISDRRSLDYVVADVKTKVNKWAYLHDSHAPNPGAKNPKLFPAYQPVLESRATDFNGVMVPTEQQKRDLLRMYPNLNVVVAPDTFVEPLVPKDPVERDGNKVLYVGRLSPEKRPDLAIRIFAKVAKENPLATLEFTGYPSDEVYLSSLKEQVKKEGLNDKVTFNQFKKGVDLAKVYLSGAVFIQTSQHEGFGMGAAEAISYGLPVVSFDVDYGVRQIVEDGHNGFLIKDNNVTNFAEQVTKILAQRDLWGTFHTESLLRSERFSTKNVWQKWQTVLEQLNQEHPVTL